MKIALSQGSYETKSIISSAQKCINLYNEKNPEDAPFPITHYLTPGLDRLSRGSSLSNANPVRCTFRTSTGLLYVVIGTTVYYVDPAFVFTSLGTIEVGSILTGIITNEGLNGNIAGGSITSAGTGYTNGTYTAVPLTGGTGSGAKATIVISGGHVTSVTITTPANSYLVGDVLSADASSVGGTGSGFTWTVSAVDGTYTNGTYTAVPLTGGTGSGAKATIVIMSGFISSVDITTPGTGYVVGDMLSAANSSIGGIGSGFAWEVATVGGTALTNPVSMQDNGLVVLIADNSANLYAIDISSGAPGTFAQVTDPNIYGATRVDILDTFFILNIPGTNEWYISLSEVNFAMLTGVAGSILTGSITDAGQGGKIATGSITAAGTSYTNGTYTAVALTGGTGAGALATIVVSGTHITSVTITTPASGYIVGDVLSAAASSVGGTGSGFTWTVATVVGTYTNGTYTAVPLTGGTGSGAQATIVIMSGFISSVDITTPGTGYVVGDVLSAANSSIGGTGSGFAWEVATVGGTAFDPLDIATKITYPDAIQSIIVMHGEIWIVGTLTTEIWYNSGAADFTFQILPGTFIEHGTLAPYSLCKQDLSVYWISQDEQGQAIVIKGTGYQAKRISNFAIEDTLSTYETVSDCIGFTYQQEGHTFVVFSFPSANATWIYDETMGLWHQRCWTDNNGNLNRHRMNVGCNAYNKNIVGDWQNGNLYALDLDTYVDNVDGLGLNSDGSYPISRIRSWPVEINENNRISHNSFRADMQVGSTLNTQSSNPPTVSLRWSDDRGATYNNYLEQSLGAQGQYLTNLQWRRLGMARGRIYELSWSANGDTALNGAWVIVTPALT